MDAVKAIRNLEELEAHQAILRSDYEQKRKAIMAQVQAELDALDVEYTPTFDAIEAGIEKARETVKAAVIEHGASVKGAMLHAVYSAGSEKWDGKALTGYAAAHPEVLNFRKVGAPSVTIRGAK